MGFSSIHSATSGELNLKTLNEIESIIRKKEESALNKNNKRFYLQNGHKIYRQVAEPRFGANIYKESFYEIQNPNNEFRIRLVVNPDGSQELAIFIRYDEEIKNYHACFDADGVFIEDDPWGKNDESYTVEIFNLYKKYREIYAQKIDEINTKQQDSKIYISGQF